MAKPQYLKSLSPKQQALVEFYVQTGSPSAACRAAGYEPTSFARLMQNPRLAEAVKYYTVHCLETYAPVGFKVLKEISEDERVDPKYRMSAAKDLLDRATGKAAQQLNVRVDHYDHSKLEELKARALELQKELGEEVLEGEWEEIPDPPDRREAALIPNSGGGEQKENTDG